MTDLLDRLAGGDRRSIGAANDVVRAVLDDRARLREIVGGMSAADPVIRMRAADVAEKVSAARPEWLAPHKRTLLRLAGRAAEPELRWHLAQMLPRLGLDGAQRRAAVDALFGWLGDRSRIVQTCAMQALAEFAEDDEALRARLAPVIARLERTGSAAVRARARRIVRRMRRT